MVQLAPQVAKVAIGRLADCAGLTLLLERLHLQEPAGLLANDGNVPLQWMTG